MEKQAKIAIGIGVGVLTIATLVYFRKQIKSVFIKGGRSAKNAAKLAVSEWDFWNKGQIKEGDSATMQRLRDYWTQGGGVNWSDSKMKKEAWSAAFISYIMKKSGAGDNFKYSTSHSAYIRQAVKNSKEDNEKTFKAFKPSEVKVEVGDLVCYPRQSGVSYDKTGSYMSHCNIVTEVNRTEAQSIGGNVSNSVSETIVPLTNKGYIDKSRDKLGYGGYFVVIKNII
jgi:hypothetical protein